VTSATGEQLGIMPTREALRLAEEQHLDLVEVAPKAKPPVCRIMDFGKYRYEQQKREKEAKKKAEGHHDQRSEASPSHRTARFRSQAEKCNALLERGQQGQGHDHVSWA
jgi:translation initiation factor IF-3